MTPVLRQPAGRKVRIGGRLSPWVLPMSRDVRTLVVSDVDVGSRAAFTGWTRNETHLWRALVELRCEIDARMHRGASFSSIEDDVIDTSDLSEEPKSAL